MKYSQEEMAGKHHQQGVEGGPRAKANHESSPDQAADRMDVEDAIAPKSSVKSESAIVDEDIIVEDDSMAAMQAMMGFGGFGTTHEKKVAGNDVYAVRKEKKTQYRQYMNRVGGFNRPLSPPRET